jgi:hypothetical protein
VGCASLGLGLFLPGRRAAVKMAHNVKIWKIAAPSHTREYTGNAKL